MLHPSCEFKVWILHCKVQLSCMCLAVGLDEQADKACNTFEQDARAASSQLAHAADFADHTAFQQVIQLAQRFQHLQGDLSFLAW